MILTKFGAGAAVILALTGPAVAVAINTETPCCADLGWQAYRSVQARHPLPAPALKLHLGSYGAYWAGGQAERVTPEN
ncbi:MAG: hypothetical protein WAK01_17970 [Methylocystis sp.]